MSEASVEQFIKTAPESALKKMSKAIAERLESLEIDRAIKEGEADIKAGRYYEWGEVKGALQSEFNLS
jgi:predicted transcriptional regulator